MRINSSAINFRRIQQTQISLEHIGSITKSSLKEISHPKLAILKDEVS